MVNVSIVLDQELMVERLIIKVRVMRTKCGFATYTDKRHHGLSAYLFSRKWGIGIEKSEWNLQFTTQDNVISSMETLTQQ